MNAMDADKRSKSEQILDGMLGRNTPEREHIDNCLNSLADKIEAQMDAKMDVVSASCGAEEDVRFFALEESIAYAIASLIERMTVADLERIPVDSNHRDTILKVRELIRS